MEDADRFSDILLDNGKHTIVDDRYVICNGKSPKKYVLFTNQGRFCEPWTPCQTTALYRKLEMGDYNITRIKKSNPCLESRMLIELHDRAIVLLMLRRLLVADPVGFFHNRNSQDHNLCPKTWLSHTKTFKQYFVMYHSYTRVTLPKDLKLLLKQKLMKAFKMLCDYTEYYRTFEKEFNWYYSDLESFKMN